MRSSRDGLASVQRAPVERVLRSSEFRRAQISLHLKILAGYVVLGAAISLVFYLGSELDWVLKIIAAFIVTLVLAVTLPYLLLRVSRVRLLSNTAQELSRGDLSRRVVHEPGALRDDIDELAVSIADMQDNLRELVSSLQYTAESVADSAQGLETSAEGVNAQAGEVGDSIKRIANGAESQKTLVDRASKSMTEMALALQKTAAAAEETTRVAAATSTSAEEGSTAATLAGEKLRKVFSRIETASHEVFKFGEKTQEISKIVEVITQVAQQTNLLALNATIEAARAGEAGRGFAVVADEVRKLAESSGRSAEQISRLARDIAMQSTAVVSTMRESIEELEEGRDDLSTIVKSMGRISEAAKVGADKVANISDSAREHQRGGDAAVQAVNEISNVAKANARATEAVTRVIEEQTQAVSQMTSAAQELSNLSDEMQSIAKRFKLS